MVYETFFSSFNKKKFDPIICFCYFRITFRLKRGHLSSHMPCVNKGGVFLPKWQFFMSKVKFFIAIWYALFTQSPFHHVNDFLFGCRSQTMEPIDWFGLTHCECDSNWFPRAHIIVTGANQQASIFQWQKWLHVECLVIIIIQCCLCMYGLW